MGKKVKFATQIDQKILRDLKGYAKSTDRKISAVVSEAVEEYLRRTSVRPLFQDSMDKVISENEELLRRLAK